jgi:hypothetical protein
MRRFLKGVLIFLTTIAMLTGIVVGIPLALLFKTTNQPFNKNTTDIELRFGDRLYEAVMNRRAIFEENPDKAYLKYIGRSNNLIYVKNHS